MNNEDKKYDLTIDNYISNEYSICREERQYALYLSNVLRYYGNKKHRNELEDSPEAKAIINSVFKKIDGEEKEQTVDNTYKNIYIENVFYEATFMRDIFERNRRMHLSNKYSPDKKEEIILQKTFTRSSYIIVDKEKSFNRKLIQYCIKKDNKKNEIEKDKLAKVLEDKKIDEVHYGMKVGNNKIPSEFKKYKNKIRVMMNSKPDLAVIYEDINDKEKYLLFLECKFDSDEDKKEGDDGEKLTQTKIQGYIAEFLHEYYLPDIGISKIMLNNKGESKIVRFYRKKDMKGTDAINIASLISLEKKIFETPKCNPEN